MTLSFPAILPCYPSNRSKTATVDGKQALAERCPVTSVKRCNASLFLPRSGLAYALVPRPRLCEQGLSKEGCRARSAGNWRSRSRSGQRDRSQVSLSETHTVGE